MKGGLFTATETTMMITIATTSLDEFYDNYPKMVRGTKSFNVSKILGMIGVSVAVDCHLFVGAAARNEGQQSENLLCLTKH